jgi:hypothetical protein
MKILRHEAGHAVDNAFVLRRRREPAPFGRPRPAPRDLPAAAVQQAVRHPPDHWYAQAHPDEDFAETFAIWLTHPPKSGGSATGCTALRKLEYMHRLMAEIAGREPVDSQPCRSARDAHPALREHYQARDHYGVTFPAEATTTTCATSSDRPEHTHHVSAVRFLKRHRREVARTVAAYQYAIDQVLSDIFLRCRALNLRIIGSEKQAKRDFAVLLTVHVMNYLHSGGYEVAL